MAAQALEDATLVRGIPEVSNDRGEHRRVRHEGAAMQGSHEVRRHEWLKLIRFGLGDEVLRRLDEEHLVSERGEPISVTRAGARLPGASRGWQSEKSHFVTIL